MIGLAFEEAFLTQQEVLTVSLVTSCSAPSARPARLNYAIAALSGRLAKISDRKERIRSPNERPGSGGWVSSHIAIEIYSKNSSADEIDDPRHFPPRAPSPFAKLELYDLPVDDKVLDSG